MNVLDFESLIKDQLLTLGYIIKPDWMSDCLYDLYEGIVGYYPNAVFASTTEFEREIAFYFKRELNDEIYNNDGSCWAMGISKNILTQIFIRESRPENNGVSIGKIKWVMYT